MAGYLSGSLQQIGFQTTKLTKDSDWSLSCNCSIQLFSKKCQHPPSKPKTKCRFCIKHDILAETKSHRNQPIFDNDPFDKDIMYFNYKNTGDKTWSSLITAWHKCQMDRLDAINLELKAMEPHLKTRTVFSAAHL